MGRFNLFDIILCHDNDEQISLLAQTLYLLNSLYTGNP